MRARLADLGAPLDGNEELHNGSTAAPLAEDHLHMRCAMDLPSYGVNAGQALPLL